MDAILVKIFAAALTFSQVATAPDAVKTQFDPAKDQQQVVDLLRAGCARMRKVFDIEDLNIDDLIATAMDDPDTIAANRAVFRGINIGDLLIAYRQFCKNERVAKSPVDIAQVIEFYNRTLADLPDHTRLEGMKLPGVSTVLDRNGDRLSEIFAQDQRRVWVALADIPASVQSAFVAAEDKRFYQHHGIDERAVVRAFIGNLAQSGRPQGASTITQQVIKNLLLGETLSYERKIREMVLASRVEHDLSKSQILELYLNSIYLGRGAWGVEMASRSYFGKSVNALTVGEGALLAAMAKGPNYFNPDRFPARAKDRFNYVIARMQEDSMISAGTAKVAAFPDLKPAEAIRPPGSYFADQVGREIKTSPDLGAFRTGSYVIHSTLDPVLQQATESALQDGLASYERDANRVDFRGPEANLAAQIGRLQASGGAAQAKPVWRRALASARLPLSDVHWDPAVVIEKGGGRRGGDGIRVGLADGRMLPLEGPRAALMRLNLYDVVLVHATGRRGGGRAELRVRPTVQGAAVVLENATGRILAMAGGFSYGLSQLNRATQAQRQPGSALKPVTYLAALQRGLQPNTLVADEDITFPPINGSKRKEDYWTPKNSDGSTRGIITLRQALENSRNLATAHLLERGIEQDPPASLDRVCALAVEAQIYKQCVRFYPFILGAQPVRPIDLAAFYATIANEGVRPAPHAIETIEKNGRTVYQRQPSLTTINAADKASFYQLKAMLQGVVQRGTARAIGRLAPFVAGKTGTTDDENDAWFVGFTNDVTVAVWVGYDNADGKRLTLGSGQTGGAVAVPIFASIIEAVWAHHGAKIPLRPPSAQARLHLAGADRDARDASRAQELVEYLRKDARGRPVNARFALVSPRRGFADQRRGFNEQRRPLARRGSADIRRGPEQAHSGSEEARSGSDEAHKGAGEIPRPTRVRRPAPAYERRPSTDYDARAQGGSIGGGRAGPQDRGRPSGPIWREPHNGRGDSGFFFFGRQ